MKKDRPSGLDAQEIYSNSYPTTRVGDTGVSPSGFQSFNRDLDDDEIADALSGKRVLIVEDEMLAAMELIDMLEAKGCEIIGPAATLTSANKLADTCDFDSAVLDITLRDGEVFPFAQRLTDEGTPFMFATAYGSSAGAHTEFSHVPVVPKPYPERRLLSHLAQLLNRAG